MLHRAAITLLTFSLLMGASCGVPQATWEFDRMLLAADRQADDRDYERALGSYQALLEISYLDAHTRYIGYRIGLMQERLGRCDDALRTWGRVYAVPDSRYDEFASRAAYRSARIYRTCYDDPQRAIETMRGVALAWPSTGPGADAFMEVVAADRDAAGAAAALSWIAAVYPAIRQTDLAPRALYTAAQLLHNDLQDYEGAQEIYTLLASRMTRSAFTDDAIWGIIQVHNATGDVQAEQELIENFLRTREVTWFMAHYDSIHYQPAYFRLVEIHRERGDTQAAIDVLIEFTEVFWRSMKLPQIYFQIAELYDELGQPDRVDHWLGLIEDGYSDTQWQRRSVERFGQRGGRR